MKKSFGKATLGGGNKMSVYMHGYGRSTHNLNKVVRTTMNVGTLIPLYTNIGLNGDTWDIDLNALIKTKPAIAPLFGTYKYQVDVFTADMRLYISALHNNPLNVGLNVEKIKIPSLNLAQETGTRLDDGITFNQSALLSYLGLRAVPKGFTNDFNAIPMLAYYDIFKNYYANKQEDKAFVISPRGELQKQPFVITSKNGSEIQIYQVYDQNINFVANPAESIIIYYNSGIYNTNFELNTTGGKLIIGNGNAGQATADGITYAWTRTDSDKAKFGKYKITITSVSGTGYNTPQRYASQIKSETTIKKLNLVSFDLKNIDDMREKALAQPFYTQLSIDAGDKLPYSANLENLMDGTTPKYAAEFSQNGICVKTFQSDIYQNWLNTEWVDGVNGISEITKVDTTNGLNLDALNLAQKVYNMLNRIAVSGGSWEDWQEAVYGNNALRRAESPVYHGGMSCRIGFEEVTSNASADDAEGDNQPLGTLAGKGQQFGKKGGRVTIHVKEPCVIMVIASITPFIDYSQGNKWYMEELKTVNDLHKPALDGIGFQNLPQYQVRGDAKRNINIGKSPAWIHYMTDVNECYGDFAIKGRERYMVLQKEFEMNNEGNVTNTTTYIDPTQFNYTFADTELDAQNFWVQQAFDIKCRRIMSAKVIPNL